MKQAKKILSENGQPMLSARAAANTLSCAPDYIGKLCRDGKLTGTQVNGAWFVYEASLDSFISSRHEARAARSEELSMLRRQELSSNGFVSRTAAPSTALILNPFLIKMAAASAAVGFIFVASVAVSGIFKTADQGSLSAALGQLRSPFFGTGEQVSLPSLGGFGEYILGLFSSDVHVQVTVRGPAKPEDFTNPWATASTSVPVVPPAREASAEAPAEAASNQQPQIIINPVVDHTVERVVVENGISPALLSSIVKELAIGSDGAIQYSRDGSFAASSTALVWDNKLGTLTVAGELHADQLCIQGVCMTKEQLKHILSTTTASISTP